jgi:hypothetical protein
MASSPPSRFCTGAVAIRVGGHRAFEAIPASRNSAANPSAHRLMPYLAIVYATLVPTTRP